MTAHTVQPPVRSDTAVLQRISPMHQWFALSERGIRATLREGDLIMAFTAPLTFFICVYVPLRRSMESSGMNYAQFLLPLSVLQAMFFASMFAGDRAAREVVGGMSTRLRAMPVRPWVPGTARLSANLLRAAVAFLGALTIGTIFGFRFHGAAATVAFVTLAFTFGAAVIVVSDALGTATANPELGGSVLFVPQLLLLMVSTGFVPIDGFPGWIQPFVRNQPISQISQALRDLAGGRFTPAFPVSAVWVAGILVAGMMASIWVQGRRR